MDSFVFLFKNIHGTESRFNTLCGLVYAAAAKGNKVTVFFDMSGAYISMANQQSYESLILPKDKISEMIDMGVEVFICSVCAQSRGVGQTSDHVSGVRMAPPEMLSEIIAESSLFISL